MAKAKKKKGGSSPRRPTEGTFQFFLHDFALRRSWERKFLASVLNIRPAHLSRFMLGEPIYNQAYVLQHDWKGKLKTAAIENWGNQEEITFDQSLKGLPEGLVIPREGTFQRLLHDFATEVGWNRERLGQILGIHRIHVSGFMSGNVNYTSDYVIANNWKEKLRTASPHTWGKLKDFDNQFNEKLKLLSAGLIIPKEGTLQFVIHDFATKAGWNRTRLAEVLGIFQTEVSALMTGRLAYAQSYILQNDWAGRLQAAASELWKSENGKYKKDFDEKLQMLPEGLLLPEEGSFERVIHDFATKAGWNRTKLSHVLGVDPSGLTKFLSGVPEYTQAYIRNSNWKGKLTVAKRGCSDRQFETDFDLTLSQINPRKGRQTSASAPLSPTGIVLTWREAASEFVMAVLGNIGDTATVLASKLPSAAPQILKNPRIWERIMGKDPNLAKTIYRDAMRLVCRMANINLDSPSQPLDRRAAHLIESIDQA